MRFIDLFAGLGGFHLALRSLGHECVFASEIDSELALLYLHNYNMQPAGDLRRVACSEIPQHDVLCAGFPCQPFSKAGTQPGLDDPVSGDLLEHIVRIVEYRKPRFVILENVPNFVRHDHGQTWARSSRRLQEVGYETDFRRLSPHRFGVPQIRERVFIVGSTSGLSHFNWPSETTTEADVSIGSILDSKPPEARQLSDQVVRCIEAWQVFLDRHPSDAELPSFPVWSMEFGATYPYENTTPHAIGARALRQYRGSHGVPLNDLDDDEIFRQLPSYARRQTELFPSWKVRFIRQNRNFYEKHRTWLDDWTELILPFPQSFQKFEWNCKGQPRDLWRLVLQCRASGLRVKKPTTAPSLVAMTSTQVPIIAWERRYITPRECARLQSMEELCSLPGAPTKAYQAFGNAVNVHVVRLLADSLLGGYHEGTRG